MRTIDQQTIEEVKTISGVQTLPLSWSASDLQALGIRSTQSLRRDQIEGRGMPFIKLKGQIRYPSIEVIKWMRANTTDGDHIRSKR